MTAQEIFDTVVRGLRAQGAQSTLGSACRYRDHKGRKCAVGQLIPDELYDLRMENWLATTLCGDFPQLKPYLLATDLSEYDASNLIRSLQFAHDQADRRNRPTTDATWLECFLHRARSIAEHFHLDPRSTTEEVA